MRPLIRLVLRMAGILSLLVYTPLWYLLEHWRGGGKGVSPRGRWSRGVLRAATRLSGCRVRATGPVPSGGLLVANHVSYLDVCVIGGLVPCSFVAKSEVRSWPAVGWLAAKGGAIFVRRADRTGAAAQMMELRDALGAGETVVLFPEGTSSDGRQVLPFASTLLQAALEAGVPVTPLAVRYHVAPPADAATDVCWWGDIKIAPHLLRLWSLPRTEASVVFGMSRMMTADRKAEAHRLQQDVAALALLPAVRSGRPATSFRAAVSSGECE